MKRYSLLSAVLLMVTFSAQAQYRLDVEISNLRNNTGKMMLQLFDANQKVVLQEIAAISDNKCLISLKDLKPGKYAVRYYHDENLNGKLDTNIVGMPVEGCGFSNNATGKFGPPKFEKQLFDISGDTKILLKATYLSK